MDATPKIITASLPPEVMRPFIDEVKRQRRPLSWVVRDAIEAYLAENRQKVAV